MMGTTTSRLCFLSFAALASFLFSACEGDAEHRTALDGLVRKGASQEEVVKQLGAGVTVYERGTPSWDSLQEFLALEPASNFGRLRQAVTQYPRILYYTTAFRMTWIFLDEYGVVRDYYLSAQ